MVREGRNEVHYVSKRSVLHGCISAQSTTQNFRTYFLFILSNAAVRFYPALSPNYYLTLYFAHTSCTSDSSELPSSFVKVKNYKVFHHAVL
jgi:hypothetical protein